MLEVLGRGGFGIVFRAIDEKLQRVVAVKVLSPSMAATSPARKRFLREARSAALIRHDNVVLIHETGEAPLPYLVMELVPGETLQHRLDRTGPLDPAEVVRVARQVAEGLAAAHEKGLIHRDIKPSNILLDGGPQLAKITDFGLARAADDASLTRSGTVAGTPMYMAPEQAKGEALDHRADLFSLGSVMYALLTGHPPFRAPTTLAVLKRVAEDAPRPMREVIPETPEWLCRIVEKLHAKDPADRYQSAREVADVLADCQKQLQAHGVLQDGSRIPAGKPLPVRPRGKWRWAAVAALVLLVVGGVWFGHPALLYASDRGELELLPQDGLTEVIVLENPEGVIDGNKLHPAATDWLGMQQSHRLKLPPGKYQLNAGVSRNDRIIHWEVTTSSPFGSLTRLVPGEGHVGWSVIVTVERGCRTSVRPVIAEAPPAPSPGVRDGFVSLFNGRDLSGWTPSPSSPGRWHVEKGVLVGRDGPGYLVGADARADFHLRAEVRLGPGGNSGIAFRRHFQVEIRNDPLCPTGSLLRVGPPKTTTLAPYPRAAAEGEWFTLELRAEGANLSSRVNDGPWVTA
ncbi:MAG TPA: protein kinase, partial [Gemmata sp.]|nr:protein kinase [Gemmata sp.]